MLRINKVLSSHLITHQLYVIDRHEFHCTIDKNLKFQLRTYCPSAKADGIVLVQVLLSVRRKKISDT